MSKTIRSVMLQVFTLGLAMTLVACPSQNEADPNLKALNSGGASQAGTTLTATITAAAKHVKRYGWSIKKSVNPSTVDMFTGDSKDVKYTVELTRDTGKVEAYLEGQVCVTNGGAVATDNLAITIYLTNPSGSTVFASAPLDLSANPILDPGNPGETGCYNYRIDIPSPVPGATYKVTADVTITNHSGHLNTPFGPNPSDTAVLSTNPTEIDASVHVVDKNTFDGIVLEWDFPQNDADPFKVEYTKAFTCDKHAGSNKNTATFTTSDTKATGSSSAEVTVKCYKLGVSKTAKTSLIRTYTWKIDKIADKANLTLAVGEVFTVNYTITPINTGFTDSNWAVTGSISISNPAPITATINAVGDVLPGATGMTVTCPAAPSFPFDLHAGTTLSCSYSASLPDGSNRTNTATATLKNTPSGTTDFSGTASVDFSTAAIAEKDKSVTITDSIKGGPWIATIPPTPIKYTLDIKYDQCSAVAYEHINTATLETSDTKITASDGHTITVNVPCVGGCTLTQGYWKTHSDRGPAPYDKAWKNLGLFEEDTLFFLSGRTWYQVFWTPPAGNQYYSLAHQYMAAKLNILNGAATTPAVVAAISGAEAFFNATSPTPTPKLTTAQKGYISTLDQYNNGLIGPGHCSE